MLIKDIFNRTKTLVDQTSPEVLAAISISGVLSTAYLSAKAGFQTARLLDSEPEDLSFKEKALLVWKFYISSGISSALTITSILGATKINGQRTAAAVTAYSLSERAFSEYREKVVEQIGKNKEEKIRDEVRQQQVLDRPSKEVVVLGGGNVLCCELLTHRYFRSDMETLRKAQNDINSKIVNNYYVTLDEFYDLIGLPHTSMSSLLGWDSDKNMSLEFSAVVSADGDPCLAFDYNYTKQL